MILGRPDTVIVVAPELNSWYEFIKPRQEWEYGTLVVLLDRRHGERRRERAGIDADRRQADRRTPPSGAAQAQLAVMGFAILHRTGEHYLP
jgi:hypothetical protein